MRLASNLPNLRRPISYRLTALVDADEADRRRAQVLMAGVDARVVKNTTGNGLPLYQVISRPMNKRQSGC